MMDGIPGGMSTRSADVDTSPRKAAAAAAVAALLGIGGLAVAAGAVEGSPDGQTSTTEAPSTEAPTTEAPSTEAPAPPDAPPGPDADGGPRGGRLGPLGDVLDGLVEDGTLTQEQADAVTDGLREKADDWSGAHPRPDGPGEGEGPGGHHRGGPGFPGMQEALDAAAEVIGVEPDALRDGLRDGRSVAEIAADAGVDRQTVIDAIVAKATEALDQAVADGYLDADRAASLEERLPEWTEHLVDLQRPR